MYKPPGLPKYFTTQSIHGWAKNQNPRNCFKLKVNIIHHCKRNLSETEAYQMKRIVEPFWIGVFQLKILRNEACNREEPKLVKPPVINENIEN